MITLKSWPTPDGHEVHSLLAECGPVPGRDWQALPVQIGAGDQFAPDFLAISPNNKIPACWIRTVRTGSQSRCLNRALSCLSTQRP